MAYYMNSRTVSGAKKDDGYLKDGWSTVAIYRRIYILHDKTELPASIKWDESLYANEKWLVAFKKDQTVREALETVLKEEWPEKVDWDTGVDRVMRHCEGCRPERVAVWEHMFDALECSQCGEAKIHVILKQPTYARVIPRSKRPRKDDVKVKNPSPLKRSKSHE